MGLLGWKLSNNEDYYALIITSSKNLSEISLNIQSLALIPLVSSLSFRERNSSGEDEVSGILFGSRKVILEGILSLKILYTY